MEITHAQKGEEWLDRHLKTAGRTREELAQELWKRGETAVAEVSRRSLIHAGRWVQAELLVARWTYPRYMLSLIVGTASNGIASL